MRVDEFGIGFPPRLAGWKKGETIYSLNALPFGGFVKIYGENPTEEVGNEPRAFTAQSRFTQALVLVAGVAMNLLLAWVLFTGILMTPHFINDHTFIDGLPLGPAIVKGFMGTIEVTGAIAVGLAQFFAGVFTFSADLSQIAGPVGIASAVGTASAAGFQNLLSLTALISINLALVNLIPIPALDGGRLLFVAIEAVIRRPIKPVVAGVVNAAGFAFLILLMLVVTFNDVYRLIG
jgi:membrane-associated protease RseP (regulator of RpoE activity)